MTTYTQFAPTTNTNFTFTPTLDGAQYTALVVWSLSGQRWLLQVYTLQNPTLVVQKPLTASPDDYDINLVGGYFTTSSLVYRESSNNFEVTP